MDQTWPFKIPFFLTSKLGIWQDRSSSWGYRFYGLALHLLILQLTTFCQTVHTIRMLVNGSIDEFSDALRVLLILYAGILKSAWFIVKLKKIMGMHKTLKELMRFILNDKSFESSHFNAAATNVAKVSKIFYASAFFAITGAAIASCFHRNERLLQYETWFFWDHKTNEGIFWLLVALEYLSALYGSAVNCSLDLIPVIFISYTTAMLKELKMRIEDIKDQIVEERYERQMKKLQECVELHMKIQGFASDISTNLMFGFVAQTFMSSIILCTSVFVLSTVASFYLFQRFL